MHWPNGTARAESESGARRIQEVRSAARSPATNPAGPPRREIPVERAATPRDRKPRIRIDEDAMTHKTKQYRPSKRQRFLRPVFGLAAAFAAVATLGLAVVTPAALATAEPAIRQAQVADEAAHVARAPAEVAIQPARIDVVAIRVKAVVRAADLGPVYGRQRS